MINFPGHSLRQEKPGNVTTMRQKKRNFLKTRMEIKRVKRLGRVRSASDPVIVGRQKRARGLAFNRETIRSVKRRADGTAAPGEGLGKRTISNKKTV